VDKKHVVHCVDCARKISPTLEDFVILKVFELEQLQETFDNFTLYQNNNQISSSNN
jgi:histone demethylase